MKLEFAHLAELATVSREGNLSIIGIFDRWRSPVFPFHLPTFTVVLTLILEDEDAGRTANLKVELVGPEGNLIQAAHGDLKVDPNIDIRGKLNFMLRFDCTLIKEAGSHEIQIRIDGAQAKAIQLLIEPLSGGTALNG